MDSSLTYRLGYGVTGSVGADQFPRILQNQPYDTEETREDTPANLINSFSYKGMALSGSSQSAAVWNVVRWTYDAKGNISRIQYLSQIAWSTRASASWPA